MHDSDVVGEVNQHTQGTEFYGTSSNFVLLNQLFAYARQHMPQEHASSSSGNETSYITPSSPGGNDHFSLPGESGAWTSRKHGLGTGSNADLPLGRVSIINLLSNEEALAPPSRPKSPPCVVDTQQSGPGASTGPSIQERDGGHVNLVHHDGSVPLLRKEQSKHVSSPGLSTSHLPMLEKPAAVTPTKLAEARLEREYVRLFMNNMHHIHPMLEPIAFTERCEEEIWSVHTPIDKKKDRRHFLALYNIVVAVGALVAGPGVCQESGRDLKLYRNRWAQSEDLQQPISSQVLSRDYFRKSRALLGDIFEVCSLESAQTLLLMVTYLPYPYARSLLTLTKSLYCQNSLKPHACYMYCGQAVRTALAIGLPSESMSSSAEGRKAARRTWWCIYSHEIDMSCSSGRRDSLGKPRNYQIPLPYIIDQNASAAPDMAEVENHSVSMINEMVHLAAVLRRISKQIYHDSKGLTMLQKSSVAMELDALLDDWKARLPEWLDLSKVSFREEKWASKQKLVLQLRYLNARILLHRPFLATSVNKGQLQTSRHVELCLNAARESIGILYDSYATRHYFRTWWYNSTYTLYAGMIVLYVVMLGNTVVPSSTLINDVIKSRDILQSMEEATVARRSADLIREGLEVAQVCVQHRQNYSAEPEGTCLNPTDNGSQGQANSNDNVENDISWTFLSHTLSGQDPGTLLGSLIDPNVLQDFTAGNNNMPGLDFSTFPVDGSYSKGLGNDLASIIHWENGDSFDQFHEAYQ